MNRSERFRIKRSTWIRPLLWLFTATGSRAWVEFAEAGIRTHYGWHRLEIPYDAIVRVQRADWPWYAGIGWRTNLRSMIGLIGSYDGIVQIEIDPPQRTKLIGIPISLEDLYISVEDREHFLREIGTRIASPAAERRQ